MRGAPVARRVRRRLCACCDGTTPVEECACFACGKGGQGRLNRLERGLRIARRPRPWDRAMGRVSVAAHINTRIRKKYMQLSLGPNVYVGRVVHSEEGHQRALTDAAWQKPPAPAGLFAPRQPPKSRLHEPKWAASRIRARVDRGCPAIRLSAPRATAAEGNRVNMKAGGNREGCICTRDALEGKAPQLVAPEAVGQAVGGGCRSGWGQLPSVTNAIEAGTCRQGDSGWA
jgi:hypothetical protein